MPVIARTLEGRSCRAWAAAILLTLATSCGSVFHTERETNLAFVLDKNEIVFPEASLNGSAGRFVLASALPQTVADPQALRRSGTASTLRIGEHFSTTVRPQTTDLHGLADGLLGADAWRENPVVIDYRSGLLTISPDSERPAGMPTFPFRRVPLVPLLVNGIEVNGIVDTTVPDTLVLPLTFSEDKRPGRGLVHVIMAGRTFRTDASFRDTDVVLIGNRLLANFVVFLDYKHGVVGLWPDVRGGGRAATAPAEPLPSPGRS